MAGKKLQKRLYKVVKKGSSATGFRWVHAALSLFSLSLSLWLPPLHIFAVLVLWDFGAPPAIAAAAAAKLLRRGVKEVVKAVRKGEKGCVASLRWPHQFFSHVRQSKIGGVISSPCVTASLHHTTLFCCSPQTDDYCRRHLATRRDLAPAGDVRGRERPVRVRGV